MATIVAQHKIKDAERFFGLTDEVTAGPGGIEIRQFCPSTDRTAAVCVWTAESVDALREYLESVPDAADIVDNSYFEVDEKLAQGLPDQARTSG